MSKELTDYFVDQVTTTFSFLVTECSYVGPKVEISSKTGFTVATFMGKNLAIEFILDEREQDIDCKVVRVRDGNKAKDYAMDKDGVRVRQGLTAFLRRRGVRRRLFEKIGERGFREQIPVILASFASMLKTDGSEILDDSPDLFE